jgi:hypothetical protein
MLLLRTGEEPRMDTGELDNVVTSLGGEDIVVQIQVQNGSQLVITPAIALSTDFQNTVRRPRCLMVMTSDF